jgi:CO dehydrogenase nickel-insertion accessory protein CooC1
VRNAEDLGFIQKGIQGMEFLGHISYDNAVTEADIKGVAPFRYSPKTVEEIKTIKTELEKILYAG